VAVIVRDVEKRRLWNLSVGRLPVEIWLDSVSKQAVTNYELILENKSGERSL